MDAGWVPEAQLAELDTDTLSLADALHIAKPEEFDYKVACAPQVHAKYSRHGNMPCKRCHHVLFQDDDGYRWVGTVLLLFTCIYLDCAIDCAYVQCLKAIGEEEQDQQQVSFKCYWPWQERWGLRGRLRPWNVVLRVNAIKHLLPLVPDLRDPSLLRLNEDAYL